MKLSVLDLTQNILSSLDSDEVNSITDTIEARQVAEIVRTTYFNMLTRANLPEHIKIFSLDSSGSGDLPVVMYRPSEVARIEWIKYYDEGTADTSTEDSSHDTDTSLDTSSDDFNASSPSFKYVTILPTQQFLDMVHDFNTNESDVETMTLNGFAFRYKNDKQPMYCTVFQNSYIVFDSYNSAFDSTLQSSKSMAYGQTVPVFEMSDTFIPDLDDRQFPLLLNEAKSTAFIELKQMSNPKAEQESKRQWSALAKTKDLVQRSAFDQFPNFGWR